MKKKYLFFILAVFTFFTACNSEDTIVPTEGNEPFFTLPQGNHDYDSRIVELYEKYGFYVLYKFDDNDLYWNGESWDEFRDMEWSVRGTLTGKPALEEYAGKQLNLIDKWFFARFSAPLLKMMSNKVLLCSELTEGIWKRKFIDGVLTLVPEYKKIWHAIGYDRIAINGGSSEIDAMTLDDKIKFAKELSNSLCLNLVEQDILVAPEEFYDLSKSHYKYSSPYVGMELLKRGLLATEIVYYGSTHQSSLKIDFKYYVKMVINNSLEKLNGEPDYMSDSAREVPMGGVFDPTRDVNGLILKKYNIVVAYLQEKGVDVEFFQAPKEQE